MSKRRSLMGETKKHRFLQKTARVSDVLNNDFDDELDSSWQAEKSRRLSVRQLRAFRQQSF